MQKDTVSHQNSEIWTKTLEHIKSELSEQSFGTWFEVVGCEMKGLETAQLLVPNKFFGDWILEHYNEIIKSSFQKVTQVKPEITYRVDPHIIVEDKEDAPREETASEEENIRVTKVTAPISHKGTTKHAFYLNSSYKFDSFVIGPGSRVAYAAAMAISESPAKSYNPFFLYGKSGLGKTHLLQSIAHNILENSPEKKIYYTSSEEFTNSLIHSIQTRTTGAFRKKFRELDVLLIDDIQFIAGKESTQEEFFHTFNALYDANKQIVISSDRPPKEIPSLEDRLLSRFEWGLISDIQPPEFETRVAILKKKLEVEDVEVPNDILFYIAENIKTNIRELEGALIRVCAYSQHSDGIIDLDTVKDVLKTSVKEQKKITIDVIQNHIADYFHLKSADLRSKKRSKTVVFPRQLAMYLARKHTSHSFPEIGLFFGGKGHATVVHACNKITKMIEEDSESISALREIEATLFRSF